MKIIKSEVKTIYTIRVNFKDFVRVFTSAKDDIVCEVMNAFKGVDLDNTTLGNVSHAFRDMDANTERYLVRRLGFDGVDNFGRYVEPDENSASYWEISVYNYGDTIN